MLLKKAKFFFFTMFISVALISCSEENTNEPAQEFTATDSDFAGWTSWTKVAEKSGPDPALGEAHSGNDATVKRIIYIKDNASRGSNGQYPAGTRVVKETRDKDGNIMMITAMAKRGGSFNSANNGWEWFVIENNKIAARGENLMDGMCNGCHSGAKSTGDYVFSKK